MQNWYQALPNRRLELIDGKFIAGLSVNGSKRLLRCLLESWGGIAALSLTGSIEIWFEALNSTYDGKFADHAESLTDLNPKEYESHPPAEKLAPPVTDDHAALNLTRYFSMAVSRWGGCHVSGRDFVCRFGQNALTPNCSLALYNSKSSKLTDDYQEGPPEIIVEFFHHDWDLTRHLEVYFGGRVPEVWLFNVDTGVIQVLSAGFDKFAIIAEMRSGEITTDLIPGFKLKVAEGWNLRPRASSFGDDGVFFLDSPPVDRIPEKLPRGEIRWNSLPFQPLIELTPVPLTFDEFFAWTGEAKYESYGEGLVVGTPIGSRNVLGQLLMTFGLIEVCKIMPPAFWLEALQDRLLQLKNQSLIKETMMSDARKAARILRKKFNLRKIGLAGDLVTNNIIGSWSRTTLILFDTLDHYQVYQTLSTEIDDNQLQFFLDSDNYIPLEIELTLEKMIFL